MKDKGRMTLREVKELVWNRSVELSQTIRITILIKI